MKRYGLLNACACGALLFSLSCEDKFLNESESDVFKDVPWLYPEWKLLRLDDVSGVPVSLYGMPLENGKNLLVGSWGLTLYYFVASGSDSPESLSFSSVKNIPFHGKNASFTQHKLDDGVEKLIITYQTEENNTNQTLVSVGELADNDEIQWDYTGELVNSRGRNPQSLVFDLGRIFTFYINPYNVIQFSTGRIQGSGIEWFDGVDYKEGNQPIRIMLANDGRSYERVRFALLSGNKMAMISQSKTLNPHNGVNFKVLSFNENDILPNFTIREELYINSLFGEDADIATFYDGTGSEGEIRLVYSFDRDRVFYESGTFKRDGSFVFLKREDFQDLYVQQPGLSLSTIGGKFLVIYRNQKELGRYIYNLEKLH